MQQKNLYYGVAYYYEYLPYDRLNEDIQIANDGLKIAVNKFTKDELKAMKFTKEGISEDMARADRKIL